MADGARLAVDIGGTFTDVALEARGRLVTTKVLTTQAAPERGVLAGVRQVLEMAAVAPAAVRLVIHGTTLATNAIIERKGAKTALIVTEGHRDALEMAQENRFEQYDIGVDRPPPLVPRHLRLPVTERVDRRGRVLIPLCEDSVRAVLPHLDRHGVESVAVGLIHSYANPAHERRIAEILAAERPGLAVTLASDVCPEIREYERLSTACANAYVQPLMARYLTGLAAALRDEGLACPFLLMTSGGGLTTLDTAVAAPIRLVESGPAGGAILASHLARELALGDVLSFDMGGTTAKLCVIDGGEPLHSRTFEVARSYRFKQGSGLPVRIPVIEMVEIGAGGGSIAGVDDLDRIHVGPASAGSEPGPAAYGRGGEEPTVTDADVVLGRIDPELFAGSAIGLDRGRAEAAVAGRVGGRLGMETEVAALGVSEMVDENMSNAARTHAIEWGKGLAGRTVVAFGGSAPIHAARVAEKLEVDRFIVPGHAGVGSAVGFLLAPISFEVVQSRYMRLSGFDPELVREVLAGMRAEAAAVVGSGAPGAEMTERAHAYMRYVGQGHEIGVELPRGVVAARDSEASREAGREANSEVNSEADSEADSDPAAESEAAPGPVAALRAAFDHAYEQVYGRTIPGLDIEVLSWTLVVSAPGRGGPVTDDASRGRPHDASAAPAGVSAETSCAVSGALRVSAETSSTAAGALGVSAETPTVVAADRDASAADRDASVADRDASVANRDVSAASRDVSAADRDVSAETFGPDHPPSSPTPPAFTDLFASAAEGRVRAALHHRPDLPSGATIPGPALIAEEQTTTVVPEGWEARVLPGGHLLVERRSRRAARTGVSALEDQIMWSRLLSVVEEQARTLVRTAFSTPVREAGDLSAGVFDLQGRMLAQAVTGTPGHVNAMAASVGCFLRDHPAHTLREGDVLVTNDPWEGTGHLNDFTVVTPAFLNGDLVALFAATSHIADVGGRGFGADANQVFEEGIRIPIGYLIRAGTVDETLMRMVRANVREPDVAQGDLYSLAACNEAGCERLAAMMTEFGLDSLDDLAEMIVSTSRRAMLDRIRALRPGTYRHRMTIDGYDEDLELVCALTVSADGIRIDWDGTSPMSPYGINVPETYTRAYASFGVRCVVGSEVPNNAGSLSAITVTAPRGCLLNAPPPAAVSARHSIGQMLPDVVLGALGQAMPPGSVPAEGSSCLWNPVIMGGPGLAGSYGYGDAEPFVVNPFHTGGTGARPGKDGLSATSFPSGVRSTPIEITETVAPLVFWRKEYIPDSGGAGEHRGGLGQVMEISHAQGAAFAVSKMFERVRNAARGRDGGGAGAPGRVHVPGAGELRVKGREVVPPGHRIVMATPGGGGLGDPRRRARDKVREDVLDGYVTAEAAEREYGMKEEES